MFSTSVPSYPLHKAQEHLPLFASSGTSPSPHPLLLSRPHLAHVLRARRTTPVAPTSGLQEEVCLVSVLEVCSGPMWTGYCAELQLPH